MEEFSYKTQYRIATVELADCEEFRTRDDIEKARAECRRLHPLMMAEDRELTIKKNDALAVAARERLEQATTLDSRDAMIAMMIAYANGETLEDMIVKHPQRAWMQEMIRLSCADIRGFDYLCQRAEESLINIARNRHTL